MKEPTFIHYLESESFFRKIGFFTKLFFFLLISIFGAINKNVYFNLIIILLLLAILISIKFYNMKTYQSLLIAIIIFSLFWLLLSSIDGKILFTLPWGTFVSDNTINIMILAASRWVLVVLAGISFMATCSEKNLIDSLLKIKAPMKLIFIFTIAFNTIGFSLMDISKIDYALKSRGFKTNSIRRKLKRIFYIGVVVLLSNLKKIEILNQSYLLRENDFKNKNK